MPGQLPRSSCELRQYLLYLDFRIKRFRTIRKTKNEDSNIYPLW